MSEQFHSNITELQNSRRECDCMKHSTIRYSLGVQLYSINLSAVAQISSAPALGLYRWNWELRMGYCCNASSIATVVIHSMIDKSQNRSQSVRAMRDVWQQWADTVASLGWVQCAIIVRHCLQT